MDSNSSSGVVQSDQVHENDELSPNSVGSQPVAHDDENVEKHHEMKLFMNKVKAKAKKFKDTFKKQDLNVIDHGHDNHNEDHHIPDLDEYEEMDEDQEVHEAPIHESEVVRSATPKSEQVENLGKSGVSSGGTTVKGEEPHHEPQVIDVSPTTEINQNITTDQAKTFVGEEESRQIGLEKDPHASRSSPEAYTPPKYQTKVTDLTSAGTGEIDIAPVEKSFARMNVQDELKPSPEQKVLPNVAEPQSPPARSHDQYMPELSSATKNQYPSAGSHDQFEPDITAVKNQQPSAGSHDQFEPDFSTAVKNQHPSAGSRDQFEPDFSTAVKNQHPSAGSHDQFEPDFSKNQHPSAGSHDQFEPDFSTAVKNQHPSEGSHDQFEPDFSTTVKNQHPSAGSHDQFEPDFSTAVKTQYPSDGSHEEMDEDQEVHEAPTVHESEAVRSATPTSEQVENFGKSGVGFRDTTVKGEEPHHEPQVVGVSPTTEINQNMTTDPAKFVGEEDSGQIGLEEDPHASRSGPEAYTPPKYQNKATDLTGAGTGVIDIAPVEKSFGRMNVQDEPKPSAEPKVLPNVTEPQSAPAGSHNQFVPDISTATKTQYPFEGSHGHFEPDSFTSDGSHDQFAKETVSRNTNKYNETSEPTEQTFNTNTTNVEEQPRYDSVQKPSSQSSYTDKAVSAEQVVDSKLGFGEKGDKEDKVTIHDDQKKSEDASNMSGSTAEYGKNIDHSATEYGTGTNTAVGTETENVVKEQNKGASVKDYLAEKLRPGEEDKALSEVISEALHKRKEPKKDSGDVTEVISDDIHKGEEERVKKEHGYLASGDEKSEKVSEESSVNSPGKGVVDRLKGVYGSWFGKSVENQSTQEDEALSKSKDSGSEVEQVSKVEGDKRLQE